MSIFSAWQSSMYPKSMWRVGDPELFPGIHNKVCTFEDRLQGLTIIFLRGYLFKSESAN